MDIENVLDHEPHSYWQSGIWSYWKGTIGIWYKWVHLFSDDHILFENHLKSALFFFLINLFIYLAALGFRCCVQAFSSCGERGLLFVAVCGLLIAVASLVAEHGL